MGRRKNQESTAAVIHRDNDGTYVLIRFGFGYWIVLAKWKRK